MRTRERLHRSRNENLSVGAHAERVTAGATEDGKRHAGDELTHRGFVGNRERNDDARRRFAEEQGVGPEPAERQLDARAYEGITEATLGERHREAAVSTVVRRA